MEATVCKVLRNSSMKKMMYIHTFFFWLQLEASIQWHRGTHNCILCTPENSWIVWVVLFRIVRLLFFFCNRLLELRDLFLVLWLMIRVKASKRSSSHIRGVSASKHKLKQQLTDTTQKLEATTQLVWTKNELNLLTLTFLGTATTCEAASFAQWGQRQSCQRKTTIIREAASRVVKDLPALLDVGASVAQESLESVGQAIDDIDSSIWKSTTKLHKKLLKQISESCKDSDISVVSSQPSMPEEEDIGLDEIEDMGSNDDNKGAVAGTTSRIDLQKRLSSAEQEEDLRSSRRCDFLYALQL
ncbi:hypothetical protein K1719_020242 [Acacia pycnantha]|nr:hypothetical protein K1719_020242 [Acacia pycnantha]